MSDDFRLITVGIPAVAVYPPGATYGPRDLADYEFVWIMEGNVQYIVNGKSLPAPEGSFVLCVPGTVDAFVWDAKRRTRHGFCHFTLDGLPEGFPSHEEWPTIRLGSEVPVLEPVFRYLLSPGPSHHVPSIWTAIKLMLSAFVISGESDPAHEPILPDIVERVLTHLRLKLDNEPDTKVVLAELASVACCTKEHLCRVFTDAVGLSPVECARVIRLERAATMLARSNYSISEMSLIYGFANPSHFTKRFMEEYHLSPRDYRQTARSGGQTPRSRFFR